MIPMKDPLNLYGLWYGGLNYYHPALMYPHPDDVEKFDNIADAIDCFMRRYYNVDKNTPLVDESSVLYLYKTYPFDQEPDIIIDLTYCTLPERNENEF